MSTEGSIRVTCLPWKINRHMRFHLFVDDSENGLLRAGRSLEVRTQPGQHTVAIKTAGLGTFDLLVDVPADGTVNLACAASSDGLISAARSKYTKVWDGPSPMNLWLIDEGNLPEEPAPERENWWTVELLSQEALAESPVLVGRLFYRVAIRHYVVWGLISSVFFGLILFDTLYQSNPSALSISSSSVLLIASIAVMVLRAVARHRPRSLSL
jgi:hypothetical protein